MKRTLQMTRWNTLHQSSRKSVSGMVSTPLVVKEDMSLIWTAQRHAQCALLALPFANQRGSSVTKNSLHHVLALQGKNRRGSTVTKNSLHHVLALQGKAKNLRAKVRMIVEHHQNLTRKGRGGIIRRPQTTQIRSPSMS